MDPTLQLLNILDVRKKENQQFIGNNYPLGLRHTFGGQFLAQASIAGAKTVHKHCHLHALHGNFILAGDPLQPIKYLVEILRDGKNFSSRQIAAYQDNYLLFNMSASFQSKLVKENKNAPIIMLFDNLPSPEKLEPDYLRAQQFVHLLPTILAKRYTQCPPIETRTVGNINPFVQKKPSSKKFIWFKTTTEIKAQLFLHQALITYLCDLYLLPTAAQVINIPLFTPQLQLISLNHSMWFHHNFSCNEWLLLSIEVENISNHLALVTGKFFNSSGQLIAHCIQQGLCRLLNDT